MPRKLFVGCSVTHSSQPHNLLRRSIRDLSLQSQFCQTYSCCSPPPATKFMWSGIVHFSRMLRCPSVCPAFGHVHGAFAGLPVPPMYIEVLSLPPSTRKRKQPPRPPLGSARVQVCPVSLSLCLVVCCKVFVTSARKYPPRLLRGDSHALRPKSVNGM